MSLGIMFYHSKCIGLLSNPSLRALQHCDTDAIRLAVYGVFRYVLA